jgi:hypothetical protein
MSADEERRAGPTLWDQRAPLRRRRARVAKQGQRVDPLPDSATLGEAKTWLRGNVEEGTRCPCCNQMAKVYRRRVNSQQVRALLLLYRKRSTQFAHVTTVDKSLEGNGGDLSKLRYWGLTEEMPETRPDGGRAGYWRVTELGEKWILERATVARYARIYDGKLLSLDGPQTNVRQALGTKFDLSALMGWS